MKTKTVATLRLGRIRYTNTLPFYHHLFPAAGFEDCEVAEVSGSPTEINREMYEGRIEMAPISSLEYLNHQKDYLLFPGLAIGSRDFSASVLLFSKERVEGLNGAWISLSEESLSAAALVKILFKFKFGFENRFRVEGGEPDERLQNSKACLAIGDTALFFRSSEFIFRTDLSELWWNWTGKPFCFSVWAVRKDYYEKHQRLVTAFYERLKLNLRANLEDIEKLLREGLGLALADEKFAALFGYLFNLNYGLDREMLEGLKLFFRYAHELGVSPRAGRLEFIDESI